jgi:cellulose synthase operon protein B
MRIKKLIAGAVLLLFAQCSYGLNKADPVYTWFVNQQMPSGLLPSQEGGRFCFTYDQAMAVFVFTMAGDYERAGKILDFFGEKAGKGKFEGFQDMYLADLLTGSGPRAAGPNPWVLLAINYYTEKTGDAKYLPLAKKLAGWIMDLRREDGGISGGYDDSGTPFEWAATEHNLNCYAGLKKLSLLAKNPGYGKASEKIKSFIDKELWNSYEKRLYNGYKDFNFATDVASWGVLALGNAYSPVLDVAMNRARCTQLYKERKVKVDGFDFGGPYKDSHYPDLDSVWFEGTGQMVVAFQQAGREKDAVYFLRQLEKCVTPSAKYKGAAGLPYASNPGTPAYGGWTMFSDKLCVSSSAWLLFARERLNPYTGEIIPKI